MKVIYQLEGVGLIGRLPECWVTCTDYKPDKKGRMKLIEPAYFSNLRNCLIELKQRFIVKKMTTHPEFKTLGELITFLKEIDDEWYNLVDLNVWEIEKEVELERMKKKVKNKMDENRGGKDGVEP